MKILQFDERCFLKLLYPKVKGVLADATSVRFFLNYPLYCEHRVILSGATRSKVPTEAVLTECSYTVVLRSTAFILGKIPGTHLQEGELTPGPVRTRKTEEKSPLRLRGWNPGQVVTCTDSNVGLPLNYYKSIVFQDPVTKLFPSNSCTGVGRKLQNHKRGN